MHLSGKVCVVLITFLLLPLCLFAHAEKGITTDKIILGSSEALTGHAGFLGQNFRLGMMSYFNSVNDNGGIKGRKIDVHILDDQYNPVLTIRNTAKLIPKSCALIGYIGTPTTLAVLSEIEKNKIPLIGPFTGAQQLRVPFTKYVFNIRNSYWAETAALVDYAHNILKKKKIAVFYQNDGYGLTGCQGIESHLMKKYGENVICKVVYKRGEKKLFAQAQQINKCKAEVVIMVGTYDACASLIKQTKKMGSKAVFMNISFVGSLKLKELLQNYGEGVFVSQVVPPPDDRRFPAVREYQDLMKKYFPGKPFTFVGLEGFIDAKLTSLALAGINDKITGDTIIKSLESFKDTDIGIGASVTYGPMDHEGLGVVYITEIKNNRFNMVKKMNITSLMPTNMSF